MIQISQLSYSYGQKKILDNVSLSVKDGELCALLGVNGSGKSTLLKCCMGLLQSKHGQVKLNNQAIHKLSSPEIARLAAYVPQHHPVTFPFSVFEMVMMGRTAHLANFQGLSEEHYQKAEEAIGLLQLEHIYNHSYTELSGGQQQLVLIARALAQDTKVLLMDEPTASLDFKNQLRIWRTLQDLRNQGKAAVISTHDPNHVLWFCDRVVVLAEQRIFADGPPAEVLTQQLLEKVYGEVCEIELSDGRKMVVPKNKTSGA